MEECVSWDQRLTIQIDFALGIIFLLHASLRLMAAETFITFLFSIPSIVDIITLPALFLSVWIQRTWVGFRYFRFFMFVQLPDILVYVRLLEKSSAIRVAQVQFISIQFLFENTFSAAFYDRGFLTLGCGTDLCPRKSG